LLFEPEEVSGSKLGLLVSQAVTGTQQQCCNGPKLFRSDGPKECHQIVAAKASSFFDSCKSGTVKTNKVAPE